MCLLDLSNAYVLYMARYTWVSCCFVSWLKYHHVCIKKNKATVNIKTVRFNSRDSAVIISSVSRQYKLFTPLLMTAECTVSCRNLQFEDLLWIYFSSKLFSLCLFRQIYDPYARFHRSSRFHASAAGTPDELDFSASMGAGRK